MYYSRKLGIFRFPDQEIPYLSLLTRLNQDYFQARKVIWIQETTGGQRKSIFIF